MTSDTVPACPAALAPLSRLPDGDGGKPPLLLVHGLGHGAWCRERGRVVPGARAGGAGSAGGWCSEHGPDTTASAGYPSYAVSLRGVAAVLAGRGRRCWGSTTTTTTYGRGAALARRAGRPLGGPGWSGSRH